MKIFIFFFFLLHFHCQLSVSNTTIDSNSTNETSNSTLPNITYYEAIKPLFTDLEQTLINASPIDFTILNMNNYNLTNCTENLTINSTNVMACFYQKFFYLLTNYSIDFPNPDHYFIALYINPCKDQNEDLCKEEANELLFKDEYKIKAVNDLLIAWFMNNYILQCGNEFQNLESCGTFLEIHRPFDLQIIEEVRLNKYNIVGFEFTYISTKKLCSM